MSSFSVRKYLHSDIYSVSSLIRENLALMDLPEGKLRLLYGQLANLEFSKVLLGSTTFVATFADTIVGVGSVRGDLITRLFVAPGYQRSGIGSRLLNILEQSSAAELKKILRVVSHQGALAFYAAHGFQPEPYQTSATSAGLFVLHKNISSEDEP